MNRLDLQRHVSHVSLDDLKPNPRNARTHSKKQIRQIADSIRQFGATNPILVDGDGMVVAGHGRLEAARLLGMARFPVVRLDDLSPEEIRAYAIADNRLAELAGWDSSLLALELGDLRKLDLGFDLTVTGFETGDLDVMLVNQPDDAGDDPADEPIAPGSEPVTRPGDLWKLGNHLLYCGSALELVSFDRLMGNDLADAVITDPPYNVPIQGHVSGLGKHQHREFAMASGEMSRGEFVEFLRTAFDNLALFSRNGSLHYHFMDWRHNREIQEAADGVYDRLINLPVWVKTNAGMGSFYRSQHELVFVYRNGSMQHINNVELGRHGRHRTNVWNYPGANTFGAGRESDLADHPTVKNVSMIADAILDCTRHGDIVLDCFGGSGTTLLAAERTGRRARIIEIDPAYCDVVIRRWEKLTGLQARLEGSETTFADLLCLA